MGFSWNAEELGNANAQISTDFRVCVVMKVLLSNDGDFVTHLVRHRTKSS